MTFSHSVVNALESILLLRGDVDESTRTDLESLPLRADTLARVVVTHAQVAETVVRVTPVAPLARGETYSLVVTPFARAAGDMELDGSVRVFPMRVSTHEDDGAMLLETWPADGTNEVPVDLLLALLRFDGSVQDLDLGVGLRADSGYLVPRSVHKVDCTAYGFGEGMCVIVAPTDALDAGREYELYVNESLRDGTGASFEPSRVTFRTAQFGSAPEPEFVAPPCAIDEAALPFGCALSDDDGVLFRTDARVPVRAWLTLGSLSDDAATARGDLALELRPLPPSTPVLARLRTIDLAGSEFVMDVPVATTPPLARVSIAEVLADPLGEEPAQEYVELHNFGDDAVELEGFSLSDRVDALGDALPRARLAAHARALVVPDSFNVDSGVDAHVPPGVTLIRIGTSIGSSGLTNRGEPLYLRDASMHRVSAAPAFSVSASGRCYARNSARMRAGASADFRESACSPGTD